MASAMRGLRGARCRASADRTLDAMSRALEHDVVYRDVKPEIILSAAGLVVIGDRRRSRANRLTLGLGAIRGAAHLIARLP